MEAQTSTHLSQMRKHSEKYRSVRNAHRYRTWGPGHLLTPHPGKKLAPLKCVEI